MLDQKVNFNGIVETIEKVNSQNGESIKQTIIGASFLVIAKALKNEEYRATWRANLAMSYVDAEKAYRETNGKTVLNQGDKLAVANLAAENFLTLLCS